MTDQTEQQAAQIQQLKSEMHQRADLFKKLVARYGEGVLDVVAQDVIERTKELLENADLPERDLQTVMDILWDQMGDLAEFTVVEQTPNRLQLKVTRCIFADEMRRLRAGDIGFAFYCSYDEGFCQGLNPAMKFTRTKTLMQGDACCDHLYELDGE